MWIIVAFVDDVVAAVPISWVVNCNGQKQCFWPLQDERQKRAKSEIPPSFSMDDWELHDCVILLNGAIYNDFEDALEIEMGLIDIDEVSTDGLPKIAWIEEENEIEHIITENTETAKQNETSVIENFSEFQELLNRPDLCSTLNEYINEHDLRKGVDISSSKNDASVNITENKVLPTIQMQSEMLDTILKNQEEKKKILVKLMTRMYSLESAVGYNPS